METPPENERRGRSHALTALDAAGLVALHWLLVAYFVPFTGGQSVSPVVEEVFAIDVYRTARARLAEELGRAFYTYDPQVLAGHVVGLVEPFGTRAVVLGTLALGRLGLGPSLAFHSLVVLGHASFPVIGYAAARAFDLGRRASLVVLAGWSLLWFFDSLFHVSWFTGRIWWLLASGLVVLALGCLHRVRAGGTALWGTVAASAGAAAMLVHPGPALLGCAMGLVLALLASGLLPRRRLLLVMAAAAPLLLFRWPFGGPHGPVSSEPQVRTFDTTPAQFLLDFLELLGSGVHAPGAARTLFRSLSLIAGVIGLRRQFLRNDSRLAALGPTVGASLVLGYLGGSVPLSWPADPYLFVVPAVLAATLPASEVLTEIPWAQIALRGPVAARAALAVCFALLVPRTYRTVATYVPELLPKRVFRVPSEFNVSGLFGLHEPMPDALRHEPLPASAGDLATWLGTRVGAGRVVVDDPALAAMLAVRTPFQVLGPLAERGSPARDADPSLLIDRNLPDVRGLSAVDAFPTARVDLGRVRREVESYLRRYAASWVVLGRTAGPFDVDTPLLEPAVGVYGYRVRRVRSDEGLFVEGAGQIRALRLGAIEVGGATGDRVTLRFHYDPVLACEPDCRVERRAAEGDRAGFVSVPAPPPDFRLFVR